MNDIKRMADIKIAVETDDLVPAALELAKQTGLELCKDSKSFSMDNADGDIIISVTEYPESPGYRLELRQAGKGAPGPVAAEFVAGTARHRRLYGGGRNQPLARAIGMKSGVNPRVLDATAGLGKDAFVLASLGCRVDLIERSPIIHVLLENGLQRAATDPATKKIVSERMQLIFADTIQYLKDLNIQRLPDVIYMDPMYPGRTKSALVKKEMRLFKSVIGSDIDADELLHAALNSPVKRVVVKRPRQAPNIGGLEPFTMIQTKNTRYDIYIRH